MVCINYQQPLTKLLRKQCSLISILNKDYILGTKIILVPIYLKTYSEGTLDDDS